jgi:GNAT superfamily N-acetyltransferase
VDTRVVSRVHIAAAAVEDVPVILGFIRELGEYERLSHEVIATESALRTTLFGERPAAEILIARRDGQALGFALFFPNYSTFLAKPGIYLEDLYVSRAHRGSGVGRALLAEVARIAVARGCGRLEWSVLDWNEPALRFYASLEAVPMSEWTVQRLTGDAMRRLAAQATP